MTLVEVAELLRNERIDRVVAGYREFHVALKRTILLLITLAWTLYWGRGASPDAPENIAKLSLGQVLPIEAARLTPYMLVMTGLSIAWLIAIRTGRIRASSWSDVVGAAANFVGIAIMLKVAWNLTIWSITFLPLASIIIGARFSRRAFWASMMVSVLIVLSSPPWSYWQPRPAFAIFALILLIGLPLTVVRLLNTLNAMATTALRSREAQSRFLQTMSHEFRTPLNTMIPAAAMIDVTQLQRDDRELVEALRVNANALLHRVNEVLDVAAIDRGQLQLLANPFRLSSTLAAVQQVVGPQAAEKGISLSFEVGEGLGVVVVGDVGRVDQVITNLVNNAIKFTPTGGRVTVGMSAIENRDTNRVVMTLRVVDTGVGIADSDKGRIFEPFHQVSSGTSRVHGGVGLGLHIVRMVSDRMGGHIGVADGPGQQGTEFVWQVEFARAPDGLALLPATNVLQALDAHRELISPRRCLVVDDNQSNRDMMRRILDRAGHESAFAENGETALGMLMEDMPDIVFLDLHMPGLSGMDFLARVEAMPVGDQARHKARVVVVSADSDPDAVAAAFSAGATAYLTKPVVIARLLEVLSESPCRSTAGASRRRPPAGGRTDDRSTNVGTPREFLRQLGGDESVRSFLSAAVTDIEHGLVALRSSISAGDYSAAVDRLHALKNVFVSVDADRGVIAGGDLKNALLNDRDVAASLTRLETAAADCIGELQRDLRSRSQAEAC